MGQALLRFWGVRGSISVGTSSIGGNTSCVELDLGDGMSIFFDAGTGIRHATHGRKFKKIVLCISHFHWDHIQGLPYLEGLDDGEFELEIFTGFSDTLERLSVLFDERFHPVALDVLKKKARIHVLESGQVRKVRDLELQSAELSHPGKSFAFRVKGSEAAFVYATDSDYDPIPGAAVDLLSGAKWAVMDSQFLMGDAIQKAHYGHSGFKHTIDKAAELKIQNCILFHFDPNYSDDQLCAMLAQAKQYGLERYSVGMSVMMAQEGTSLSIRL